MIASLFTRLRIIARCRAVWIAAAAALVYYAPAVILFPGGLLNVHDNLDDEVVLSYIIARAYLDPAAASALSLNGAVPLYFHARLTWPLMLLQLLPDKVLAYTVTDVVVRVIALAGMYLLVNRMTRDRTVALVAALIYAFSITYTVLGFTVAGLPLALYLVQRSTDSGLTLRAAAGLILLGWNSSLILCGLFFLALLLPMRRMVFGGATTRETINAAGSYGCGLALGSAGVLYGLLAGPPIHRSEFRDATGTAETIVNFLHNTLAWPTALPAGGGMGWEYYPVSVPLTFLMLACYIAVAWYRRAVLAQALFLIIGIDLYVAVYEHRIVRDFVVAYGGSLLRGVDLSRFYYLVPFLIVVLWSNCVMHAGKRARALLLICGALQILYAYAAEPNYAQFLESQVGWKPIGPSASMPAYYSPADYRQLMEVVDGEPTISVGVDPMVAIMNGMRSVDGYFTAYPLEYKHRFRKVIAKQLDVTGLRAYFDDWGSRLYTFVQSPNDVALDYCAASDLGARYVISKWELRSTRLVHRLNTTPSGLFLYEIIC